MCYRTCLFTLLVAVAGTTPGQQQALPDIDALMADALERQDVNWEELYNYFYREREILSLEGSFDAAPLHGWEREYLWHVRDGYMVRSPMSVDGVAVSSEERERSELRFIERLKVREKKDEGRSVDRRSFFGFEFEPGNYYFAGRQMFEGREVVIVEYYPVDAFSDDDDEQSKVSISGTGEVQVESEVRDRPADTRSERESEVDRQMNKVIFATLLVDPIKRQIVRMTLENLGFDFLPARWLVQLDTLEASMTMHEPFSDIWLPRDIDAFAIVRTAGGDISVRFSKEFYDYVEIEATATYRFPPSKKKKKR